MRRAGLQPGQKNMPGYSVRMVCSSTRFTLSRFSPSGHMHAHSSLLYNMIFLGIHHCVYLLLR